jgi:hypothetical protein
MSGGEEDPGTEGYGRPAVEWSSHCLGYENNEVRLAEAFASKEGVGSLVFQA